MSKYSEHTVYKCDLCKLQAVFETKEGVEEHLGRCLMNEDNFYPTTSKHFRIKVYPFTKEYIKKWKSDDAYFQFGYYSRPYDVKKGRELEEEELFKVDPDWEKRSDETPLVILTDEYKAFMQKIDDMDDVEISMEIKDFVKYLQDK